MHLPVFFLSFANDLNNPLPNLERESNNIYKYLVPFENKQQIQVHFDPYTNIDKLGEYLTLFKNRVNVFHYGGHAESDHISLRGQMAYSDGLASQLAQQGNLQLVFLNGCSTGQQVRLLLEMGVPMVIATSAPIDDLQATEFAENFYNAIALDFTIKGAFENAAAKHRTKSNMYPRIYTRGMGRKYFDDKTIPWGLYTLGNEDVLEKKLIPDQMKNTETASIHNGGMIINNNAPVGSQVNINNNEGEVSFNHQ